MFHKILLTIFIELSSYTFSFVIHLRDTNDVLSIICP